MEDPLIIGVDGSEPSLQALDWAVDEAVRRAGALRVLHASRWGHYEDRRPSFGTDRGAVQRHAEYIAAQAVERAAKRAPELGVTAEVVAHDPATALIEASHDAGVLVVGSRGHGTFGGLLLGGVSLPVAAHAQCPVVVVRGHDENVRGGYGQVALGIGEPERAAAATEFAFRTAELRRSRLVALRAWRCPAHELPDFPTDDRAAHVVHAENELAAALHDPAERYTSVPVHAVQQEGPARDVLVSASDRSDLLVVGARRRRSGFGLQLGPVGHAVLHHSACPVAVVPHD
ncbi:MULTISPECIES: universal stress protein [unclassified Streptomyces]|uniref:universal stress protein n=1 Tax=unclassified Streptomyces TaxID=2593676 RepID=UPI000DBA81F5|nr:universal stress protein [Streptomyces sp. PsTaAH-137]MYT75129.1 universal stress protein [Streptomyces sp. SID8367]RAJ77086.1 nucleotide-binding universal stress UspA family protein [Streptomyces sp. PsTaAH-137]